MTTDIFYVTFKRDVEWFRWSVAITEKNLSGYRQIVAVAPESDRALFEPIVAERKTLRMVYIPDWPRAGYYWQQWVKMEADKYTDADVIMHIDSDVYFKTPTSVEAFFHDGKPGWLWAYYTDCARDAGVWKSPTERAFGATCDREFMQGFPFTFHRSTYGICRDWLEMIHKVSAKDYIARCFCIGGMTFSEFNFMGCVAFQIQRDLYHFVDRNREPWPEGYQHSRQFWSHAPFSENQPEIEQMLNGGTEQLIRVTNRGIWILSNDTHISKWVEHECRLDFDVPEVSKQCSHIKPGDVVVDAGAFIGDNTIAYARATHGIDTGRVIAFEPNPRAFACLTRNMAGLSHVECHNLGLSEKCASMEMALDPNVGASHLKDGVGVKVITLDSLCLTRLNFMKMDVEGFELRALKGGEKTIMACRPKLWLEINEGALNRAGTSPEELRKWLEDHRYTVHAWIGGPQFDVLCTPNEITT